MKYFIIRHSQDLKIIGEYPQTSLHPEVPHNFYDVKRSEFPTVNPSGALKLSPKANVTDYIDSSSAIRFGHVVSPRFKEILENSHLPTHKYYPIDVFQGNKKFSYFWFYYISSIRKYLDTTKTKLTIFNRFDFKIIEDDISINTITNIGDFERSLPKDHNLRIKEIVLTKDFPNHDVLNVDITFHVIQLISEKLKYELEKEHLTGYSLKEYNLLQLT